MSPNDMGMKSEVHFIIQVITFFSNGTQQPYQSPAAEQDHEDDKGLKPAVFHNLVAGLPQPPPDLAQTLAVVDVTALTAPHAY